LCRWLGTHAGPERPEELDAAQFGGALSDFFEASGWGHLGVAPVGGAALALDSSDWAEAEPGSAEMPMCFFSAGMLADLMGRVSGEPVAVMEVECRSRGDSICRFLSASPATLQEVYEKMTAGLSTRMLQPSGAPPTRLPAAEAAQRLTSTARRFRTPDPFQQPAHCRDRGVLHAPGDLACPPGPATGWLNAPPITLPCPT
jgi:hypothetical protein